jgi:hypothetical protein
MRDESENDLGVGKDDGETEQSLRALLRDTSSAREFSPQRRRDSAEMRRGSWEREKERGGEGETGRTYLFVSISLFPSFLSANRCEFSAPAAVKYWSADLLFGARSRKYSGWKASRSNYR